MEGQSVIVSITFRHGTENTRLKQYAQKKCARLGCLVSAISSVKVVFNKQHRHNSQIKVVTRHISVRANHKQHFDIYEQQTNAQFAFDRAFESVSKSVFHCRGVRGERSLMRFA
jgi:ribosome-associated translation inhibitor RaiA